MNKPAANPLVRLIATWFGCGLAPVAPGTFGSLGALSVAVPLHYFAGWYGPNFGWLAVGAFLPAVWVSHRYAEHAGMDDPQQIVVDEVVGQWIALAGVTVFSWKSWLAALLLFRIFDVLKPPPIRALEKLPGGSGIVADDLMAGFYAALVLFGAGWFNLY